MTTPWRPEQPPQEKNPFDVFAEQDTTNPFDVFAEEEKEEKKKKRFALGTGLKEGAGQGIKSMFNTALGAMKAGNFGAATDVAPLDTSLSESESTQQTVGRFVGRVASELPMYMGVSGVVRGAAGAAAKASTSTLVQKLLTGSVPGSFWKSAAASAPLNMAEGVVSDALVHPESMTSPMSLAVSAALGSTGALFDGFRGMSAVGKEVIANATAGKIPTEEVVEEVSKVRKNVKMLKNTDQLELGLPSQKVSVLSSKANLTPEVRALVKAQLKLSGLIDTELENFQLDPTNSDIVIRLDKLFNKLDNTTTSLEKLGYGDVSVRMESLPREPGVDSPISWHFPEVDPAQGDVLALAMSDIKANDGGKPPSPPKKPVIRTGPDDDPLGSLMDKGVPEGYVESTAAKIDRELFDSARPLKDFESEGMDWRNANSAYGLMSRMSRVADQVEVSLFEQVSIPNGDEYIAGAGPTFANLIRAIGKSPQARKDFSKYMLGRSGYELGLDQASVTKQMSELTASYPHFAKIYEEMWEAKRKDMAKMLVGYKIVAPEDAKMYTEALVYVPTTRVTTGTSQKLGFLKQKENTASLRVINDPLAQAVEQEKRIIRFGETQKMWRKVMEAVEQNPEKYKGRVELEAVADVEAPVEAMMEEIAKEIKASGGTVPPRGMLRAEARMRTDALLDETAGSRIVYKDGVPFKLRIDDPGIVAMVQANRFVEAGIPEKIAKGTERSISPLFQFAREFTGAGFAWDQFEGFFNTSWKDFIPVVDPMRGLFAQLTGDPRIAMLRTNRGGTQTRYYQANAFEMTKSFDEFAKRAHANKIMVRVASPLKTIHEVMGVLQASSRYGAALRKAEKEGMAAGAQHANTVLADPMKRGTSSVAKFLSYSNFASYGVQSNRRLVQAAMDNPKTFASKLGLTVTLPTVLFYTLNKDDEEIQRLRKSKGGMNFWYYRNPDSMEITAIPKPYLAGFVAGSLPESGIHYLTESALDHDPDAAYKIGKGLIDQIAPSFMPMNLTLLAELKFKKNFFGFLDPSVPLASAGRLGALPEDVTSNNTFGLSKLVAEKTGWEAASVDNFLKTLLFSQGTSLYDRWDRSMFNRPAPDTKMTFIPLAKKVNPNRPNVEPLNAFYQNLGELSKFTKSLDIAISNANPQRVAELMQANGKKMWQAQYMEAMNSVFREFNSQIRFTNENQTLPPDQRRDRINMLRKQMIERADITNKMMRQIDQM